MLGNGRAHVNASQRGLADTHTHTHTWAVSESESCQSLGAPADRVTGNRVIEADKLLH